MKHLFREGDHWGPVSWCGKAGKWRDGEHTEFVEQCDCIDCLEAATAYGARAARQKRMLEGAA